jgi:hypothetical protein
MEGTSSAELMERNAPKHRVTALVESAKKWLSM